MLRLAAGLAYRSGTLSRKGAPHLAGGSGCRLSWPRARSCGTGSSDQPGPDASRGYDVQEYAGLWRMLNERQWPQQQTVAVVGPIGNAFVDSAVAVAHEVVGPQATMVSTEPRSRWQSVRLQVVCSSADDLCDLHSRLRALEGVRAVL